MQKGKNSLALPPSELVNEWLTPLVERELEGSRKQSLPSTPPPDKPPN